LSLAIDALHSDLPRLDYFGPGTDTREEGRTDYRREFTTLDFKTRWKPPRRRVALNFITGPLFVNVGPGKDSSVPSTETVYSPGEAPGVDIQTDYVRTGGSFELDYRDIRGNPADGTGMVLEYIRYGALDHDIFSFHRVTVAVDHYVPFLNKKRVIALRGATALSYHDRDQVVPFYLQPTLGGSTTLRGLRRYRFYDENSILFNAEYRWEVNTGIDMVVFGDAGRVFDRPHNISLEHLKTSAGLGMRFKTPRSIAVRLDTGFSNEGFQVWLSVSVL
jgi:outer membrane protein assembly factor BamA